MSGVRVLVGTRKGAFVLTADGKRKTWEVSAPLFAGWEVYHVKGSPADPGLLRMLARTPHEVSLDLTDPVTMRAVLDALEGRYPALQGTIRDHVTRKRRPYVRFFACGRDPSHEAPEAPLPSEVSAGAEPLLIVGAMAGG